MLDTRELDRRAGSTRRLHRTVDAPAGLAVLSARVPEGSPLVLDLDIDSLVDGLWVAGSVDVRVVTECIRCLEETEQALTAGVEALFVASAGPEDRRSERAADRHTTGRAGLAEDESGDDDEVFALEGDLLDLEQVVRDAVVLALPLRPLCTPDCAGLRLDGTRATPGETAEPVDPRWAALAGWTGPSPFAGDAELAGPADGVSGTAGT